MRSFVYSLFTLLCFSAQAQSPAAISAYVERYKAIAIEEMKSTGIPASVTLAQGIHESGCGNSVLALKSNNHFGIKCHNEWTGDTYHHDDDAPQECFRVYTTPEESFRDHSDFLKTRPRYASLFDLDPSDYKGWAKGLKAAGYATNPKYPQIIIKLIEDYKLYDYDKGNVKAIVAANPALDAAVQKIVAAQSAPSSQPVRIITTAQISAPEVTTKDKPAPVSPKVENPASTQRANIATPEIQLDERLINGIKAVVYKPNTPVAAIARKYDISIDQLFTYNDLAPGIKIKDGEFIYLEPKKSETTYYQYEIGKNETMRDVSQKFGIQLSELNKRNGINDNTQPQAGEIIVLRGKRDFPLHYRSAEHGTPSKSATTATASTEESKYHKVSPSDTLFSIARQYHVAVDDLVKMNGLKDYAIRIGQTLVVSSL